MGPSERRSCGRYPKPFRVEVRIPGGDLVRGRSVDVGLGGLRLVLRGGARLARLRLGAPVRVRVFLQRKQRLTLPASVLSVRPVRRLGGLLRRWEVRVEVAGNVAACRRRLYELLDAYCGDDVLLRLEDHRQACGLPVYSASAR